MLKITKQEKGEQIEGEADRARNRAVSVSLELSPPYQRMANSFRKETHIQTSTVKPSLLSLGLFGVLLIFMEYYIIFRLPFR